MKLFHAALVVSASAACALLAGCGDQKPTETAAAPSPATPDLAPCADDAPRLPVTGLCAARAIDDQDPSFSLLVQAPAGCEWVTAETAYPGGEEALVYRALSCKGVTTALELHAGAHSAALGYVRSALFGEAARDQEPVKIFTTDPADPQKAIRDLFESIPEAERATCAIEPAGIDGWPKDALVIRPNAAARAQAPDDGPLAACGPYGVDEDSQTFWRLAQGYAYYFNLGQEDLDFDPASFRVFRKGADGSWAPAP